MGKAQVEDDLEVLGLGDRVAGSPSPTEGPQEEEHVWVRKRVVEL